MIKRILFFLALFFIAFGAYFVVNRQGAENFIMALRNKDIQNPNEDASDTTSDDTIVNKVEDKVEEVKEDVNNSLLQGKDKVDEIKESVKDSVLVVSDDIKDVINDELGLDNWGGTVIVMQNPTFNIDDSKQETTVATPSTSSSTRTSGVVPGKLSDHDLEMLRRLAKNID